MANTTKRDVELIIRAKDLGSKTFKDVAAAVQTVTKALDEQVAAAERGAGSAGELRSQMRQLQDAGSALVKQQGLVDLYGRLGGELEQAKTKAADLARAYEAMKASQADAEKVTAKEEKALERLRKQSEAASAKVENLTAKLDTQKTRLSEAGLSVENLADEQQRLVQTAEQVGAALQKAQGALDGYDANLRKARQGAKDLADAEALAAFRELGVRAEANAAQLDTMVSGVGRAQPAVSNLALAMRQIIDPTGSATAHLAGLEAEVSRLTAEVGAGDKPIIRYQDALNDLSRVQAGILKQAGLVDTYRAQEAAVAHATTAYKAAQGEVRLYASEVQKAGAPNADLANKLRQAEAALAAASREMDNEQTKLRRLEASLGAAGIETKNLAAASQRLQQVSEKTASALQKLDAANRGQNSRAGRFLGLRPYELQNLSFQVNDFFTQIASGASVTQAFAQQGGQVIQIFPQLGTAIASFGAELFGLGLLLAPVVAAIKNAADLSGSVREFTGLLTLNAEGARYNAEALADTAHRLDVFGGSLEDAKAGLKTFMEAGIAPEKLESFGRTAQNLADVLGKEVPQAAQMLSEGFSGGYEQIAKLDDATHFLTVSERENIKAMFDNGDSAKALETAYRLLAERADDAANKARGPWAEAWRSLASAWDNFVTRISNTEAIQGVISDLQRLANMVNTVANLLPGEPQKPGDKKKPHWWSPLTPGGSLVPDPLFRVNSAATRLLLDRFQGKPEAAAPQVGTLTPAGPVRAAPERTKAGQDYLAQLREQSDAVKRVSDAERVRTAGLKALREAQNRGASEAEQQQAKELAASLEQAKVDEENKRKSDAAKRKSDAAARQAESAAKAAEARRQALVQQLVADERSMAARIARNQQTSLAARQDEITQQYAKVYDTLAKLEAAGGKAVNGSTLEEYRARIKANEEILKQYAQLDFYEESLSALEEQRAATLKRITDQAAAGNLSTVDAYKQAQAAQNEFGPKISAMADEAVRFAKTMAGANPSPEMQAFIARMEALGAENARRGATNAPDAKVGQDLLRDQETEINNVIAQRNELVSSYERLVELGVMRTEEAQAKTAAAYASTQPLIDKQVASFKELLAALAASGAITQTTFDTWAAKLEAVNAEAQYVDANFTSLKNSMLNSVSSGITQAFDNVGEAIGRAIDKTGDWGDVVDALGQSALSFTAQFLKGIADILIQVAVLQAVKSLPFFDSLTGGIMDFTGLAAGATALAGPSAALVTAGTTLAAAGPALTPAAGLLDAAGVALTGAAPLLTSAAAPLMAAATALSAAATQMAAAAAAQTAANAASVFHGGGIAGSVTGRTRMVPSALIASAPRFHGGGVPGLNRNEVVSVLERDEEVLTRDDPRHVLNGGKRAGGGGGSAPVDLKVVNVIDPAELVGAALATKPGQQVMMNFFGRNASAVNAQLSRGRKG